MEIKQSRNSNRIRYELGEDELHYTLQDGSGSRSFSVQYTEISRDRQTLEERNQWLRNVASTHRYREVYGCLIPRSTKRHARRIGFIDGFKPDEIESLHADSGKRETRISSDSAR